METTVAGLTRARIRHFISGVGCLALSLGAAVVGAKLDERAHLQRSAHAPAGHDVVSFLASALPATERMLAVLGWIALVAFVVALYHLWQWRGKGRRYRNQKHRAANELLRADFRRTGRT
jgi:hypothetical protein